MDNEGIELLNELIKLDIDATHAYHAAIGALDGDPTAQGKLRGFKADHERHVRDLSAEVSQLGGTPSNKGPDIKGYLRQGFTAIKSAFGEKQAIEAMRSNEEVTNKTYADALRNPNLPASARTVVQANYEDEQRHLRWINEYLARKVTTPA